MKFIIFGQFSFSHVYFLCYACFTLIPEILRDELYGNNNKISQYFYNMYLSILSRILSLIPYFINKKLTKSKKEELKEKKKNISAFDINFIYTDQKIDYSKNLMKSILKVAIFEFLAESFICIFYFINDKPDVIIVYPLQIYLIINTITQYLVSHFVLNYMFYKHHYLSFGINIFCTIIFLLIDILEIIYKNISDYQYYIYVFMRIFKLFLFACEDNYAKHALYKEFLTPFSLMVYMAIIESILLLIFSIPFIFIKTSDTNKIIFVDFGEYLKGTNILLSLGILISNFLFETFVLVIIDRFSPSHLPLGFIIYSIFSGIYSIIRYKINNRKLEFYRYSNFFLYIILFIGAMIHNEIFIINKWGFNNNTKLFLELKLNEEKRLENDEEDDVYDIRYKSIDTVIPLKDMDNSH